MPLSREADRKRWHKRKNKSLWYRGAKIYSPKKVRSGICASCGEKGRTENHHLTYDDTNPFSNVIELCPSCHTKMATRIKGKIKRVTTKRMTKRSRRLLINEIRQIKNLWNRGLKSSEISKMLGLSYWSVYSVASGRTWIDE